MSVPDNQAQIDSASFRLPALDPDFILDDSQRGTRLMLEYAKAELRLRQWGIRSTLVVFGSARTLSPEQLQQATGLPQPMRDNHARWYGQAREFARIASREGGALMSLADGRRDNVIVTGGGPGIMEAANRGAADAGAPSIGLNITLPHEQQPNPYSTPQLTFRFHYFAMRKLHFAMRARAMVVFPGGFGTLDELFELLTLSQTRKMPPIPVIMVDPDYWRRVINFDLMVSQGMIGAADPGLISYADDGVYAWKLLCARGLALPGDRDPGPV